MQPSTRRSLRRRRAGPLPEVGRVEAALTVLLEAERDPFTAAVAARLVEEGGALVVDYIRLNMLATRSEAA
jgi:hypothetical protein